jgi:hypothetical protein
MDLLTLSPVDLARHGVFVTQQLALQPNGVVPYRMNIIHQHFYEIWQT